MARPAQKKQRVSVPATPTKSTNGKGKAKEVLPARRVDEEGEDDDDDEEEEEDDDDEDDEDELQAGQSMAKETTGDNYFHKMAEKNPPTSAHLLSTFIDPAFTLSSYAEALSQSDASAAPELVAQRAILEGRLDELKKNFGEWTWQLEQGFSILLYGFGSKKDLLNSFGERLRKKGNVVVVNGFDVGAGLGDVVQAMEGLIKLDEDDEDAPASPSKSPRKGKGKAKEKENGSAKPRKMAPKAMSAIEGRIRRFCRALATSPTSTKDVFLLVHSLDGAALRSQKTLSLLALLAAQPRLHLIASVDHLRAPLLFSTSLSTARPVATRHDEVDPTGRNNVEGESLAFTWIYHDATTMAPFTQEVISSSLLSTLLPPSIYPPATALLSASSTSLAQSTIYVLQSVSIPSKRLFSFLADIQSTNYASFSSAELRSLQLAPPPNSNSAAPPIAIGMNTVQTRAQAELIAVHMDKLEALLAEFKDHGVVRTSFVPPESWGEETEGDGSNSWIWIPLGTEELEEVRETLDAMLG